MQCVFHTGYSFGTKIHCIERCKTINNLCRHFFHFRSSSLSISNFIPFVCYLSFSISTFYVTCTRYWMFFSFFFLSWANFYKNAPANGIILCSNVSSKNNETSKIARLRATSTDWEEKPWQTIESINIILGDIFLIQLKDRLDFQLKRIFTRKCSFAMSSKGNSLKLWRSWVCFSSNIFCSFTFSFFIRFECVKCALGLTKNPNV